MKHQKGTKRGKDFRAFRSFRLFVVRYLTNLCYNPPYEL